MSQEKQSQGEIVLTQVRRMTTGTLLEWIAGKRDGTLDVWIGKYELERRKNKWAEIRSWITIGISLVALGISIIALVQKQAANKAPEPTPGAVTPRASSPTQK